MYDAEIVGAVEGLRAACSHWMSRFAKNVAVCLDNEEAAIRLHSACPTQSSSTRILDFQRLRSSWSERERAEATALGTVPVRWIPGHKGIAGNERADALAKEASGLPAENTETTVAQSKKILQELYQERLELYWSQHASRRYLDLGIGMNSQLPPEISLLPRRSLGRLLAARSGHGDFAECHRRFKHTEADLYCSCGQEKSPEHPFSCQLLSRSSGRPRISTRQNQSDIVKWSLGTTEGAKAFHKWNTDQGIYD